jgi:anti-anti-sigma factor
MRMRQMEPLEVREDPEARLRILRLTGDVDLGTAAGIAAAVAAIDGRTRLAIDLSEVTFIDSAGLRALLRARYRFGRRLWLVAPSAPVRRLLRLTDMTARFAVVDRLADVPGPRSA